VLLAIDEQAARQVGKQLGSSLGNKDGFAERRATGRSVDVEDHARFQPPGCPGMEHAGEVACARAGIAVEAERVAGDVIVGLAQAGADDAVAQDGVHLARHGARAHGGDLPVLEIRENFGRAKALRFGIAQDDAPHDPCGIAMDAWGQLYMDDIPRGQGIVAEMPVQKIPSAARGDGAGAIGIAAKLYKGGLRNAGGIALRPARHAGTGRTAKRLVRDRGCPAEQVDLGGRLDQAEFGDHRANINEASPGKGGLERGEAGDGGAVTLVVETDHRRLQPPRAEAGSQDRRGILPVAIGRHVRDPASLATDRGVEGADEEEGFCL